MTEKKKVEPSTCVSHEEGRLNIEVQLPGVDKSDISLDLRKDNIEYSGCFKLAHEVESNRAEAKYENGLLRIFAPIKDWDKKTHVMIH